MLILYCNYHTHIGENPTVACVRVNSFYIGMLWSNYSIKDIQSLVHNQKCASSIKCKAM